MIFVVQVSGVENPRRGLHVLEGTLSGRRGKDILGAGRGMQWMSSEEKEERAVSFWGIPKKLIQE